MTFWEDALMSLLSKNILLFSRCRHRGRGSEKERKREQRAEETDRSGILAIKGWQDSLFGKYGNVLHDLLDWNSSAGICKYLCTYIHWHFIQQIFSCPLAQQIFSFSVSVLDLKPHIWRLPCQCIIYLRMDIYRLTWNYAWPALNWGTE